MVRVCDFCVHLHYRLQALKEPVYTQKEADMAAGMGNYVLKRPDTSFADADMKEDTDETERD